MRPIPSDLRDFAERYTAAWCSQNAASVAAFFSENGILSVNDGVPAVGRASIQQTVKSFMTAFPDLRVLFNELVIRGDEADYHWTLIGTFTGTNGTGNHVKIQGVEHWQFAVDGLIAASRGEFDEADYQRQISGK